MLDDFLKEYDLYFTDGIPKSKNKRLTYDIKDKAININEVKISSKDIEISKEIIKNNLDNLINIFKI